MKRFIIIVSVYDEANTQAYPLGGIFDSHKAAKDYMLEHLDEVLGNHWTKDREDGIDEYFEEVNLTGFEAKDNDTGQSLEIDIHEVPVMSNEFPVIGVTRDDLEQKGFKADDLNDDTMEVIAAKISDYMLDELDYWSAVVASCEFHEIPRKEE